MSRLYAVVALGIGLCSPALAQDIGGQYTVSGTGHDGATYGGTATITGTSDTTCEIVWETGPTVSAGICMRYDNVFAAGYVLQDLAGLAVYEVLPDGTLSGTWTIAGMSGSGTEVLTPIR